MILENNQNTREYNKGLIEALIFLSGEPVKLASLADSIKLEKSFVRELLEELILDYSEKNGGFLLKEIAGGYQFLTNEVYYKVLGSIFKEKKRETLSRGTLDTLAIISYKQPITLPEIDEIRGVSSRNMVSTLIAKKLVKAVGQKEVPGRPTLYGTTNEFLIHFGLNKLSDLPMPVEVKELKFDDLEDLKPQKENFNIDHIEAGIKVFKLWNMPLNLQHVVSHQDFTPDAVDMVSDVDRVTRLAGILAMKMLGFVLPEYEKKIEPVIYDAYNFSDELKEAFGEDYYEMIKDHPFFEMMA